MSDEDSVYFVTEEEVARMREEACESVGLTWDEIEAQHRRGWFDSNRIHQIWFTFGTFKS